MFENLKTVVSGVLLIIGFLILFTFKGDIWNYFFPEKDTNQKAFNVERTKYGILPIPLNWVTRDNRDENKTWMPPTDPAYSDTAVHFTKSIITENGKITREFDAIGRFGNDKQHFQFVIDMTYTYPDKKWKIILKDWQVDGSTIQTELSISKRDSILKSWHFDYEAHLKNWK